MSILNFSKANCKNCYKCLRACPVKAIRIQNEQAEIVEDLCIGCGQCLMICPQNARQIKSDLQQVQDAIKSQKTVIASVAPSFPGAFDMESEEQLVTALKKLGFSYVEEAAVGADVVADLYKEYIKKEKKNNYITSACPSVNDLIEKYFPALIEYLIPIVSPMIAHGKMIKKEYGMDGHVVFIGPCPSKKIESIHFQHDGVVDSVLTFEELYQWLEEENIHLKNLENTPFDKEALQSGKSFPIAGSVLKSFLKDEKDYEMIYVDGIDQCMKVFESLQNGTINNACIEANICLGSCIGGAGMPKGERDFYKDQRKIKDYIKEKKYTKTYSQPEIKELNFFKKFLNKEVIKPKANEEQIKEILKKIGKYHIEDELNCGGCGYNTCREKAQAVFEGMAQINMCMPFMRNKAERLTNVIFEHTPNIIILVDEQLNVKEFNPTAEKVFKIKAEEIKNKQVSIILDEKLFLQVKNTKENITGYKMAYSQYEVVLLQSILYLEKQNVLLAIMTNTTSEEKHRKELVRVKERTIDAAQEVIEKQMRVAQEIASLLGETTAETKIILTKLKQIALEENGDIE
ncbi:[Fe-Fe] hydrogenase large subunit C-terminal domain-containing protein [Inediibacterium massiliense]|uniref:[Fe-Fe] hydrogenase large subunit C-terminal domain-containing protein n=1 Tax=Inediibacterium massiliense TaxID=1658111 RepID=UPI000DA5FEA0|nr:[Fe-Fe] hydrogenase large subunit C-terminal domain-containing protein [Inediibacterium massiliense]